MPSDPKTSDKPENLRDFSAYVDENGQHDSDAPNDLSRPAHLQQILASDPGGEAETARLASGRRNEDGTAATEAEVPPGTIERLGDPSLGVPAMPEGGVSPGDTEEAVDRATSGLGRE